MGKTRQSNTKKSNTKKSDTKKGNMGQSSTMSCSDIFVINLRGLMAMKQVSPTEMQRYMCIAPATWYRRIKHPYEFTLANMESAARRLGVELSDMISRVMAVGGDVA